MMDIAISFTHSSRLMDLDANFDQAKEPQFI